MNPLSFLSGLSLALVLAATSGCKPDAPEVRLNPKPNALTLGHAEDRTRIHLGDPVKLTLVAYYPSNALLVLPNLGDKKNVLLLDAQTSTSPGGEGLVRSETRYVLTSLRLGRHPVSTNDVVCKTIDGQTFRTNFPGVVLRVESSLTSTNNSKLSELKPFKKLPGRIPTWVWIVLATAAVAFLFGRLAEKLRERAALPKPSPPPPPPHVLALEALRRLSEKGFLERNESDPFYVELSAILREYLEGRFRLNAPEQTTEEIVEGLSRSPELTGRQRNVLLEFLRRADLVKFAKGSAEREAMQEAFDVAKRFVQETIPAETTSRPSDEEPNPS